LLKRKIRIGLHPLYICGLYTVEVQRIFVIKFTGKKSVKREVSERTIYAGVGTYWAPRGFLLGVEAI
jgi:hypothetical protein